MAEGRIIKLSAFLSDSVSRLSDFEFRLWVGLITNADNMGRGDARPAIIKGQLFSLRDKVRVSDIERALKNLANNGSISLYEVAGKPFYEFPNWFKHQRLRKQSSDFPGPDDPNAVLYGSPQRAAACCNLPQRAATCGLEEEEEVEVEEEEKIYTAATGYTRTRACELDNPELGRVMTFFLDKINATPSPMALEGLTTYTQELSADVVLHALGIALDERKTGWRYIQGILQRYAKDGIRTMDDVLRAEQAFEEKKQQKAEAKEQKSSNPFKNLSVEDW